MPNVKMKMPSRLEVARAMVAQGHALTLSEAMVRVDEIGSSCPTCKARLHDGRCPRCRANGGVPVNKGKLAATRELAAARGITLSEAMVEIDAVATKNAIIINRALAIAQESPSLDWETCCQAAIQQLEFQSDPQRREDLMSQIRNIEAAAQRLFQQKKTCSLAQCRKAAAEALQGALKRRAPVPYGQDDGPAPAIGAPLYRGGPGK